MESQTPILIDHTPIDDRGRVHIDQTMRNRAKIKPTQLLEVSYRENKEGWFITIREMKE